MIIEEEKSSFYERAGAALALMMVVGSILVLVMVGGRHSGGRPMVSALVPFCNVYTAIGFGIFQLIYCAVFKKWMGIPVFIAAWVLIPPLIAFTAFARYSPEALSGIDRNLFGAACVSALLIGGLTLKGKI